jgi:hypothetical protein
MDGLALFGHHLLQRTLLRHSDCLNPGIRLHIVAREGVRMAGADSYMVELAEELAKSLRLIDGKSGYVEAQGDVLHVYIRRK